MTAPAGILAIIPARGGSKRLPGKNLRLLNGKPLIAWTIEAAIGISDIRELLVSTDDEAIASVARLVGAHVPWLRPAVLATDSATSVDVAIHALDRFEADNGRVSGVLLLQPTSPFRTKDAIRAGIDLYLHNDRQPVLGVSPIRIDPSWTYRVVDGALSPFAGGQEPVAGRFPDVVVNGAFYLVSPEHLRTHRSFTGPRTIPLLFESEVESLDIDTPLDFALAECIARDGGA